MSTFKVFLWTCICCAVALQIRRLLLKKRRLLPKSTGFIHIYISEMRCSFAYGFSGAAFMSSGAPFVTAKQHRYRSGVSKPMYHRCFCHPFNGSGTGTWNWGNMWAKCTYRCPCIDNDCVVIQTCLNKMYNRFQFHLTIMWYNWNLQSQNLMSATAADRSPVTH